MLIEGSKLSVGANVTLNNISVLALQWTYPRRTPSITQSNGQFRKTDRLTLEFQK